MSELEKTRLKAELRSELNAELKSKLKAETAAMEKRLRAFIESVIAEHNPPVTEAKIEKHLKLLKQA